MWLISVRILSIPTPSTTKPTNLCNSLLPLSLSFLSPPLPSSYSLPLSDSPAPSFFLSLPPSSPPSFLPLFVSPPPLLSCLLFGDIGRSYHSRLFESCHNSHRYCHRWSLESITLACCAVPHHGVTLPRINWG